MLFGSHGAELIILFILAIIAGGTIFWLWMLIDCAINKGISDSRRLIWILVIIFTHLLGAFLYFLFGRSAGQTQNTYRPYSQSRTPQAPQYYPYQQGYQAAPPPPPPYQPAPAPPPLSYEHDYEQPQAMYPHEQNNE